MNDREQLNRLHDRFTADAAAAGLLDVAYRIIDSPLGRLLVAETQDGVVRVAESGIRDAAALESGIPPGEVSYGVIRFPAVTVDRRVRDRDRFRAPSRGRRECS